VLPKTSRIEHHPKTKKEGEESKRTRTLINSSIILTSVVPSPLPPFLSISDPSLIDYLLFFFVFGAVRILNILNKTLI
jgi:hypothetical protein